MDEPRRYSNDLDYVRTTRGPVGPIMDAVRQSVAAIGLEEVSYAVKSDIVNIKFDAEPTRGLGVIRVKIEINTQETEPCFDRVTIPFSVDTPWFAGSANVLTFELEELLGTKLRALYQRRKGRDLFDLWLGLDRLGADPTMIVAAFSHYLSRSGDVIEGTDFEANLEEKLKHTGFRRDLDQLWRAPPVDYSPELAATVVRSELLRRLH